MKHSVHLPTDWLIPLAPWLVIGVVAVFAGAATYGALRDRVAATREAVAILREDLTALKTGATELARYAAPTRAPVRATNEGILVVLERTAEQAGVREAVASLSAGPAETATVAFHEVAWSDWLQWVLLLEQDYGLTVRSATLSAGGPGLATGQAVFGPVVMPEAPVDPDRRRRGKT